MGDKHLRLKPYSPLPESGEPVWYYETPHGIEVYAENKAGGSPHHFTITWRTVRGMLARKDKPDA